MLTLSYVVTIKAQCEEAGCDAVIEIEAETFTAGIRKLRAAGWAYTAGYTPSHDKTRCPVHRRLKREVRK